MHLANHNVSIITITEAHKSHRCDICHLDGHPKMFIAKANHARAATYSRHLAVGGQLDYLTTMQRGTTDSLYCCDEHRADACTRLLELQDDRMGHAAHGERVR